MVKLTEWVCTETGKYKRAIKVRIPDNQTMEMPEGDKQTDLLTLVMCKPELENEEKLFVEEMEEIKLEKQLSEIEKLRVLQLEREKKAALLKREIEVFSSLILRSMKVYDDEQIRDMALKMYNDSNVIENMVTIYQKYANTSQLEHYDFVHIVRQSIIKIVDDVMIKIEKSHSEFPQVSKFKTLSKQLLIFVSLLDKKFKII